MTRKEALHLELKRYHGKACRHGHGTLRYSSTGGCVECCRINAENWSKVNNQKRKLSKAAYSKENKDKVNFSTKQWHKRNKHKSMYTVVKARARAQGLPFNLEPEDIVFPETCPILGIPLFFTDGGRTDNTPSLDKVKPELGYVKGNVCVISWRANRLKCDGSLEEFENIVKYLKDNT